MKKKIAIVIPSLRGGGAEKVMVNVISKLDRNKFDITLILIKKEGPYIESIPKDISVIDLNSNRVRYSIIRLWKALNKINPDTILSTLGHLNLLLLAIKPLLKGRPKIIVREANTPSKDMGQLTNTKRKIYKIMYKSLYKKADNIIAQCEDMKDDMIKYLEIDEKKIECIFNPLDIDNINILKEEENPYFLQHINLIAVGRLEYQKGFDILIEAFKIVSEKIHNIHLTILGEGSLKVDLEELIKSNNLENKVSILNFRKNPYKYYYHADMYILSSRWEGFPNTLLEALACGTKVVSMDCKSGPREILENGKYGELIKHQSGSDLAQGILNYINEENRTGSRASYFAINNIIKEYEKILN